MTVVSDIVGFCAGFAVSFKKRGFSPSTAVSLVPVLSLVLTACSAGDAPSSQSAADASANVAARDAAQEGRVLNPDGVACIRANATLEEWAIIVGQDANGEAMLQTVLDREETARCFRQNRVTVYL